MSYRPLALHTLVVNRANDRHGELENETAAIAWLFNTLEPHMRNLAKDIAKTTGIYEPPLVCPDNDRFVVFDGNRRVACLKLLHTPRRAPTVELQEFFGELRSQWKGDFPDEVQCHIETDRDKIDDILYRRHTGSQGGVGQSTWDDRMKSNFISRTGKASGVNVADEVEKRLADEGLLPRKKIPRANMNRLLSAEAFRNRVGFTMNKGRFEYTHQEPVVLHALKRIADDLTSRKLVLGSIWDVDGKRDYLDQLEREGILPKVEHSLAKSRAASEKKREAVALKPFQTLPAYRPVRQPTLIPNFDFQIAWSGRMQRQKAIWEELQFRLMLADHPNAISVLFRVLLDLSVQNYIDQVALTTIGARDTLAQRVQKVADDLYKKGKITKKYLESFDKFARHDALISADTLNRYVHSQNFAPSPEHLRALWDNLSEFIVKCLNAPAAEARPNNPATVNECMSDIHLNCQVPIRRPCRGEGCRYGQRPPPHFAQARDSGSHEAPHHRG